jgi:hypothetical protein
VQVGIAEISFAQIGAPQVGTAEVGPAKVGLAQIHRAQVGLPQRAARMVHPIPARPGDPDLVEVDTAQVPGIEIQSRPVEQLEGIIAGLREAHPGLLAGEDHLLGFQVLPLAPFSPSRMERNAAVMMLKASSLPTVSTPPASCRRQPRAKP